MLDERPPAGALRSAGAMYAVEELADGDDADRAVLVSQRTEPKPRGTAQGVLPTVVARYRYRFATIMG